MDNSQYDSKKIEPKWQEKWEKTEAFFAHNDAKKKKFYGLIEFPYPSGEGLHAGHVRSNTAMDVIARKRRAEGFEVLYPIGWDAFGLPTENYAIKTGIHPIDVTKTNTDIFRRQLKSLGFSFDWSREINTTEPAYYKWTQWIFLRLYKHGLAYKAKSFINWCPKCKIGLANEEVVGGACERCGFSPVEKREKEQWMLAITKYAQRLYDDLDGVDYIERAKTQQRNWIGPSEGAEIEFKILAKTTPTSPQPSPLAGEGATKTITVFTTRPDTLFGATYIVLAPEHPLVAMLVERCENAEEIRVYIASVSTKEDIERTAEQKEKTGVELKGVGATNPANGEEISVWIADYVLGSYGTGAVMAVPAHDERDFEFAKKFGLDMREVISGGDISERAFLEAGNLMNSGEFDGVFSEDVKKKITEKVGGKLVVKYKLRDWVFSRQRYWGEPIPMVKCEVCAEKDPKSNGWVPVPESELPVKLPKVDKYQPTDTGESPLSAIHEWVNTKCPKCGGDAKRETDVMPNWAGSSWYSLRYCDSHNNTALASSDSLKYWTPVDWYNGGMEHVTLHLLYSRFWHKFLFDIGVVPTNEPYAKRTSHGLILAGDGTKMSKSKGNVVNPDGIVNQYGADALRVFEMFIGPFDQDVAWNTDGVIGSRRFLERVWRLQDRVIEDEVPALVISLNKTIKKVGDDIEQMKFNTAVSQMMIFLNESESVGSIGRAQIKIFVQLLAPFAPHTAEELWEKTGGSGFVHNAPWPKYDEKKLADEMTNISVQINGKVRGVVEVSRGASEEEVTILAKEVMSVRLADKIILRTIFVQDRIINFVCI